MRSHILTAALALVAATSAVAGARVTTELVSKLAKKYAYGEDGDRYRIVAKYAPGIQDFQVRDAVALGKVFKYDGWRTKFAKEQLGLLPSSLSTQDVGQYVKGLIPYGEDGDRFGVIARLVPKLPPLDEVRMAALTELFKHDGWKTKLLMETERFLAPRLETRQVVALVKNVAYGEDSQRWAAMQMLVPRWRTPAPEALVKALAVFKYDGWKQKAVVQLSMRWYNQGLTTSQVLSLVKVIPYGEDSDRYGLTMRLLPQVRDFDMEDLDRMEKLFKYQGWQEKFLEAALPYMGL